MKKETAKKRLVYAALTLLVLWFVTAVTFAVIGGIAEASPKAGPSNMDAVHLRCVDCGTATPVFVSDQGLSSDGGSIFEARVLLTPVARINPKGVWGNLPVSLSVVSGTTAITPSSNLLLIAPSNLVTISKIYTANWQNGAKLLVHNAVSTNTVFSETTGLNLSAITVTLGLGDNIELIYDQSSNTWFRSGGSDN